MSVFGQRERVLVVARTWLGTPYHAGGRVKGAGADCLTLLAEVYSEAGVLPRVHVPYYPKDWHLHRGAERYMEGLLQYAHEIEGPPLPADIVLWKFGRCYSHGAIVVQWPMIIHAYCGRGCTEENAESAHWLTRMDTGRGVRPVKYFTVF